jgi:hypothetical protein
MTFRALSQVPILASLTWRFAEEDQGMMNSPLCIMAFLLLISPFISYAITGVFDLADTQSTSYFVANNHTNGIPYQRQNRKDMHEAYYAQAR